MLESTVEISTRGDDLVRSRDEQSDNYTSLLVELGGAAC